MHRLIGVLTILLVGVGVSAQRGPSPEVKAAMTKQLELEKPRHVFKSLKRC